MRVFMDHPPPTTREAREWLGFETTSGLWLSFNTAHAGG